MGNPLIAGALSYKLYGSLNYQTLVDKVMVIVTIVTYSKNETFNVHS